LGKSIKFRLTENGYKVRWVVSRELALSSVLIKTNKLLTRGTDFDLFFSPGKIIVAKTVAVQDFSDYEFRDIKRPARDLVSGITPPKLAKMMINLGGRQKKIFDPFCGSGTFLMEAALLGFKKIYGSDVSEKAVADTKKNLAWLKEKYNFSADIEVRQCDVRNSYACWNKKFDFIATEPYLGPALRGKISSEKALALRKELEKNYREYLTALSKILEKNGLLVIIVPFIIGENGIVKISLKIEGAGLEAVREPIPYCRPDQKVGREIYILRKVC
jgi:tRNA G10  N-methylase Trm11